MKYLKNINPYEPVAMGDMVKHTGNKIASKSLIDNGNTEIRFFSFGEGESIDKEYYTMETLFCVLQGSVKILYRDSDEVVLNEGEMIALESGISYGIEALIDAKLFNVLVKV
jgi:quercetin dioxygenase-like cupin family protein